MGLFQNLFDGNVCKWQPGCPPPPGGGPSGWTRGVHFLKGKFIMGLMAFFFGVVRHF